MDVSSLTTLVGFAAGCFGLYSFVPQVLKCCRTGETAAISLRMFSVSTLGHLLWTLYGFALGSLPVLIFSALGLVLSAVLLVLKIRGSHQRVISGNHKDTEQRQSRYRPETARSA